MSRQLQRLLLLGSLAMMLSLGVNALHAGDKGHREVKISHVVSKPDADGKQKVTFTITPDDGWYLYANPVGHDFYVDNTTQIKAKGATIKVTYPPGKDKTDKDGRTFKAYMGTVQIVAEITRSADAPAVLTVHYNACDKNTCLTPARVPFKID